MTPAAQFDLLKAALASRYSLLREIGRGGMATVYLAQDVKHERPVALKILHPELAASLGPERFLREIKLTARLQHPHILPVFDSGEADGQLWYAMPYVEGESLRARLMREPQLPLDDALRITSNVLAALTYAHGQGIIHRDIKPENILLEGDEAVVADFGVARAVDAAAGDRLTETGLALGTPAYMSPEQAAGETVLDGRSDIYAVGCVLYEMLAGEPPYTGATAQAVLAKRFHGPIPSLRGTRERVPEAVDSAIGRALARAPADRFTTAAEFARSLWAAGATDRQAESGAVAHPTQVHAPAHAHPAPALTGTRRAILLTVGALVVAGASWMIIRQLGSAPPVVSTRLAVLPFSTSGSSKIAYLAEGMVDLLSRNLNGVSDLRTIDAGTVLTAAAKPALGAAHRDGARGLARRLGAGLYVLGSVHAIGGRMRIQAELRAEADTAEGSLARAIVEGDTTQLFQLVDRLSADLLAGRGRGLSSRLMQSAALTTRSLPALKAYLEGERNLRGGDGSFDSAIAGFQRAVAEDSTFALAYYRLGVAAGWAQRPGISGPAISRALALGSRLDDRDRRLLSAFAAFQRGTADDAEQQYRSILRDYPDDLEAEFQLADLFYQYNPPRGRPIAEAREPFDHVLALDPGFLCPI